MPCHAIRIRGQPLPYALNRRVVSSGRRSLQVGSLEVVVPPLQPPSMPSPSPPQESSAPRSEPGLLVSHMHLSLLYSRSLKTWPRGDRDHIRPYPQKPFALGIGTYLLPQTHNLEPLKVIELLPPNAPLPALRERAVVPLGLHIRLLPLLLQRRSARAPRDGDHDAGEGHV